MRIGSMLACAAMAPFVIAASKPVTLQPSSPWVVDYGENSCRLIRTFGDVKHPVKVAFQSEAPGSMDMLAIGSPLESSDKEVSATFGPTGVSAGSGKVVETIDKGEPAIFWPHVSLTPTLDDAEAKRALYYALTHVRPPAISLADRAAIAASRQSFAERTTEISIEPRKNHPVILETGSLGDAIKAFDKCGQDSLKDWGIDPDLEAKIVRPAWSTNSGQWLLAKDYPPAAAMRGEQADVEVRLLINAAGRVTNCVSLSHFNEDLFNKVSCQKITERARFEPAELADGTKVPSYHIQTVTFRLRP